LDVAECVDGDGGISNVIHRRRIVLINDDLDVEQVLALILVALRELLIAMGAHPHDLMLSDNF
jgi:hypothetical protein